MDPVVELARLIATIELLKIHVFVCYVQVDPATVGRVLALDIVSQELIALSNCQVVIRRIAACNVLVLN